MSHHRFLRAAGTLEIDANIRNPRIYCVNSCFLMFSGFQTQMSYLASKNDILTFQPWHYYIHILSESKADCYCKIIKRV